MGESSSLFRRPAERMVLIVGGLLFFRILEGAIPLLDPKYKNTKARHAIVNLAFTALHLVIQTGIAVLIVLLADWCQKARFGLAREMGLRVVGTILLAFFVKDFLMGWRVHFVEHTSFAFGVFTGCITPTTT